MSSYLVDNKTIQRIITAIYDTQEFADKYGVHDHTSASELGQRLFDLNTEAVNQRYRDETEPPTYVHAFKAESKEQQVKSIRCFLYQCSEGTVPDDPLFAEIERLAHVIALDAVCESDEYEEAEWG